MLRSGVAFVVCKESAALDDFNTEKITCIRGCADFVVILCMFCAGFVLTLWSVLGLC